MLDELVEHRHLRFESLVVDVDLRELVEDERDDVALLVRLRDDLFRLFRAVSRQRAFTSRCCFFSSSVAFVGTSPLQRPLTAFFTLSTTCSAASFASPA